MGDAIGAAGRDRPRTRYWTPSAKKVMAQSPNRPIAGTGFEISGGSERRDAPELAGSRTQFLLKKLAHCRGFHNTFQDGIPPLRAVSTDASEFEIRSSKPAAGRQAPTTPPRH